MRRDNRKYYQQVFLIMTFIESQYNFTVPCHHYYFKFIFSVICKIHCHMKLQMRLELIRVIWHRVSWNLRNKNYAFYIYLSCFAAKLIRLYTERRIIFLFFSHIFILISLIIMLYFVNMRACMIWLWYTVLKQKFTLYSN